MKRMSYLILMAFSVLLVTCKKYPELKIYNLEIVNETVEKTQTSAKITVKYSYPTELKSVDAMLSENESFSGATKTPAKIENDVFSVEFANLKADSKYYYRFSYCNGVNVIMTEVKSFTTYAYVDLGLPSGLLWATCNIGATNPEDYGDYYAWGETSPKSNYEWSTYQWCNGSNTTLTKYCTQSGYGFNGFVDDKTVLEPADDAAHVNWGGDWRMPTYDELAELKNNCTWTWTTKGGKNGYRVTGSNNNSIFLPAAGYYYGSSLYYAGSNGIYWSSSLYTSNPNFACFLHFYSCDVLMYDYYRYFGQSVRPVCASQK